ncbi:MAG TPA: hypothetical protein VFG87_03630 [Amycolatopsis sp.]|jgi:hypothetical protein|nr:hypothetical protein [Amycolatopsis sp.]
MNHDSRQVDSESETEVTVAVDGELSEVESVRWAVDVVLKELATRGIRGIAGAAGAAPAIRVEVRSNPDGHDFRVSEAFSFTRPPGEPREIVVFGDDPAGATYGLLELADRVRYAEDPLRELERTAPVRQTPSTPVRSISRTFVSDVQDKPWFHDRAFWDEYLTELAMQRINRLQLALGMQYNYSHDRDVRDNYLCFAYPFLLAVPGFDVFAEGVDHDERTRNLAALRYISDEAKRRGIHFQLGLWNHGYEPMESPRVRYPIRGLSAATHAAYCAAALDRLLQACPAIDGLTLRVHYEGGVHEEGHEDFWREVLGAVRSAGRPIEIDLHAKGVDQALLDIAVGTGSPVVISAKYWAEHQGLPYHQTAVREREKPTSQVGSGLRAKTQHTRRFTRYGYGDFLREDREFDVVFRIWPGTQRVLLWGDPVFAAGYGRLGTLGGARGVELCEPLSFRGRKDSGAPDARDPYLDPALRLGRDDWKKYLYTYRLWGRLLYDPDADPESWRRFLRWEFGTAAPDVEQALSRASRILPLVTVVHGIGASNNWYWPEVYLPMPIAGGAESAHYGWDTVEPKTFGGVSSFDPGLFDTVNDHADNLLAGRRSGKYTPEDTAAWLDRLAEEADDHLAAAESRMNDVKVPAFRRLAIDVRVQAELGRFFAARTHAGLSYALYQRTGDPAWLCDAVTDYRNARAALAAVVSVTEGIYRANLAFGNRACEFGHWKDRLSQVDADLAALEAEHRKAAKTTGDRRNEIEPVPRGHRPALDHVEPAGFRRGDDFSVDVAVRGSQDGAISGVTLHYRHLNHGEDYRTEEMTSTGTVYTATIPAEYTDSAFPLVYYFTVRAGSGDAWLAPGFDDSLANQPYHVIRQSPTTGWQDETP